MNLLTIVSFLVAGAVFGFAVFGSTKDPRTMLDIHGFVIVIAGSIAATAISFQLDRVWSMIKVFFGRILQGKKVDYKATIKELMMIAEAYRTNDKVTKLIENSNDPFIKECMQILTDGVVEPRNLRRVCMNRVNTIHSRYNTDAKMFQVMGKYPPAMGLMGAVLGMIALLATLGKPGAEKTIGPSMSIALVATFYGIAFANLFVIPIGENLGEGARENRIKNTIIVEGVLLIAQKTNPVVLVEELNSFLLPSERISRKEVSEALKKSV
jgi:chemotaxis protein MotA